MEWEWEKIINVCVVVAIKTTRCFRLYFAPFDVKILLKQQKRVYYITLSVCVLPKTLIYTFTLLYSFFFFISLFCITCIFMKNDIEMCVLQRTT